MRRSWLRPNSLRLPLGSVAAADPNFLWEAFVSGTLSDLSRKLAQNAEGVCRYYLAAGSRIGRYWIVGDTLGSPGRSLYVRLNGGEYGKGAAGKWTDAATGEHGDLLDLIGINQGHRSLNQTLDEARLFLSLPKATSEFDPNEPRAPAGSRKAARRLFAASRPIAGTLAEAYLRKRGITGARDLPWLRFHPRCWYRPDPDDAPGTADSFPALIAAVTDNDGTITGVHRTWLNAATCEKADIATPRRAMGDLLGHGVRFGMAGPIMAAGEGLETLLSLRMPMPALPTIACLSAAHLAALAWPKALRRLYVVRDADGAGTSAWSTLRERGTSNGIEILPLVPPTGADFNDALRALGREQLAVGLAPQLVRDDVDRFLIPAI